jgi:hypothetical protein
MGKVRGVRRPLYPQKNTLRYPVGTRVAGGSEVCPNSVENKKPGDNDGGARGGRAAVILLGTGTLPLGTVPSQQSVDRSAAPAWAVTTTSISI